MLRIDVPAAIRLWPHQKAITSAFASDSAASSKFQQPQEAAPREQCGSRFERGRYEIKTKKLMAATLAASMALASLPAPSYATAAPVPGTTFGGNLGLALWPIFGCAGGIILAALAANYRDNRQLTTPEAWSCGLLFWFSQPKPKKGRH